MNTASSVSGVGPGRHADQPPTNWLRVPRYQFLTPDFTRAPK